MKLYRIQALLMKYWYVSINSLDRIIDMMYFPFVGMITFGFTTLYIEKIANFPEIIIYLMGGMLMWTLFERVQQDVATYILEDFWSRNIANTFVTPIRESEIFVAVCILGLIRSFVSFAIMFLLAFFAYQFNLFRGGVMAILFVLPLYFFAWAVGILISGVIFKYGTRIQVFAWSLTYLLQPFAAVYYPLSTLPPLLQHIAEALPLVYSFEGFRLAYEGTFSMHYFLLGLGLSLIYFVIGYYVFTLCVKSSRKSGLLTKY